MGVSSPADRSEGAKASLAVEQAGDAFEPKLETPVEHQARATAVKDAQPAAEVRAKERMEQLAREKAAHRAAQEREAELRQKLDEKKQLADDHNGEDLIQDRKVTVDK